MSFEITTAFVQQYRANVMLLSQQRGSVLQGTVVNDTQVGKNDFVDQIGATEAQKRSGRHSDTPIISTPHSRRRLSLVTYDWADLIDNADKVRMLIDPASPYAVNAAMAMGRAKDDEIISAALGTAHTGEDGSTTVALSSGQKVAAASAGLTVAKLRSARKILRENEVPEDEPLFIAVTADQTDDLLGDNNVTSADFNTVKALVQGEVTSFMSFTFRNTERLTTDGSSNRQVIAYAQTGVQMNTAREPVARIDERADKNYATQVYTSMDIGATRLEEAKVVEIACVES